MDAEEFLDRYAAGIRQFHKGNRQGIDLKGADLSEIDLFSANWNGADLSEATLTRAKLNHTSLSRASLTNASPES
ncbi:MULTISPECIES: pentapeptide repeat-containing protein [Nostoc]|uniref:Pentapeptide repeat-containing protein n=1 Tax=Nostoc paludosum FACHB-159 TaxID=2692908 RepID=A0ABR8KAN4_9NOSO|nr:MULTISPECIES: pentapeptide repeat-containing protein [Nostoc]MBD2679614.1 pentapeptide repeat-containing protein [Nostoc sp. FACHB-857]MBD2735192.1 pentapeptide repeat-containing protein [Nostoc paludosum FACHB-159]